MAARKSNSPKPPKFTAGGLRPLRATDLDSEAVYRSRILEGDTLCDSELQSVSFEGCVFRNVDLSQVRWHRIRLVDVQFEQCVLTAGRWSECSLERAELTDCRALGLHLPELRARDLRLTRVQAPLSLWFRAETRTVWAQDCDLTEAVWTEAKLPGAVFRDCKLTKTDFRGAALTGGDLRGSILEHTRLGLPELSDVTVEAAQLLELAHLLGVRVQALE